MTRQARPRQRCILVALALCATAGAGAGEPQRYAIDPIHTRVMFEIDHAGFSKAIGTVSGSEGILHFDPDDWSTARLDVTVPMRRLDMGDADLLASVFAPRFLDVERYPQARFVSTRVERQDDNRGTVCGELTLHGTTRPLCMDLVLNRMARHPLPPFRRTVGFSARANLRRSEFGMNSWKSLVGDEVELRIEAELVRRNSRDREHDDAVPDAETRPIPAPTD